MNLLFQTERAFQHQPTINLNKKGQKGGKALRYHRNVGLGFKTPREVSKRLASSQLVIIKDVHFDLHGNALLHRSHIAQLPFIKIFLDG